MQILNLSQTDSTNNYAKALIREGKAEHWQVVRTAMQSAGRGQASNTWESEEEKNLLFSILFRPEHISPKEQFIISQAVSVSVAEYLRLHIQDANVRIKWPNDVYVGMKKIAGILIEHSIQDNHILFSVIGVGLNVNQTAFSKHIPNPISLHLLKQSPLDVDAEFDKLIRSIANALEQMSNNNGVALKTYYLQHLLFLNEEREYRVRDEKIIGKIIGVNDFGLLQIQTKNRTILEFGFKEIAYIL